MNPVVIERAELEKHPCHQQPQSEESAVAAENDKEGESEASGRDVKFGKSDGRSELEKEAWGLLNKAVVTYCGSPVGTMAADDPSAANEKLNYDQVFIRDFVPSAIAFLMKGESEIVRNFLLHTLQLQVKALVFINIGYFVWSCLKLDLLFKLFVIDRMNPIYTKIKYPFFE